MSSLSTVKGAVKVPDVCVATSTKACKTNDGKRVIGFGPYDATKSANDPDPLAWICAKLSGS